MHSLDFLSSSPSNYIFQYKTNKTFFGGLLFIIYFIIMLLISFAYILDYFLNDKYDVQYSVFYKKFDSNFQILDNIDYNDNPEENSKNNQPEDPYINFGFELYNSEHKNLSDDYIVSDKIDYIPRNYTLITQKVSNMRIIILSKCESQYKCEINSEEYQLEESVFILKIKYKGFNLDHESSIPLDINNDIYFEEEFPFTYNNNSITMKYLNWRVIKYTEEKGISRLYDRFRGNNNEYTSGYIESSDTLNIAYDNFEPIHIGDNYYRFLGIVQMRNPFNKYIEYKRKKIEFLDILANIGALFESIHSIFAFVFGLYSENFDNYKMIENILSRNNLNNKHIKLSDINNPISDNINKLSPLINNEENLAKNSAINDVNDDDDVKLANDEPIHIQKFRFIHFFLNNLYFKKCSELKTQEILSACNDIVSKYLSIDYILYNQIKLESLLNDYKWNNPKLNNLKNNELVNKLINLL